MKKIQKSLADSERSFIVIEKGFPVKHSLFCPVCDFVMTNYSDYEHFDEYDCCKGCFLRFVESRKKMWLDGWRPSDEEINTYKGQIRCNSPAFILS
jgi:hypothetical protein